MSSWFNSSTVNLAKMVPADRYYYLTPDITSSGYIRINSSGKFTIYNSEATKLPKPGVIATAIPKWAIDNLSLSDFIARINGVESPLSEVISADIYKNPEMLSLAFLSGGLPCIDLGKTILLPWNGRQMDKIVDLDIVNKLNKALDQAIFKFSRVSGGEFILGDTSTVVTICLSRELRERLTHDRSTGSFKLPNPTV